MSRTPRAVLAAVTGIALLAGALAGCHAAPATTVAAGPRDVLNAVSGDAPADGVRTARIPAGVHVASDIEYGVADDGTPLTLDACTPPPEASAPLPAVIAIHGGSWKKGDKGNRDWRSICRWLAGAGFVTYSVNYRLVPHAVFPAAIDDVSAAVTWARSPRSLARFGVDPTRIGVLGGSAGASLAALLAMRGSGATTSGTRVSVAVELSGPVDLTAAGQDLGHPIDYVRRIELDYLDCTTFTDCPQARAASAVYAVDASDPPVFIAQSSDELIPREQGDEFARALSRFAVPHTVMTMPGQRHSVALLDPAMRADIEAFLHRWLG